MLLPVVNLSLFIYSFFAIFLTALFAVKSMLLAIDIFKDALE